jgi:hypothetical protein
MRTLTIARLRGAALAARNVPGFEGCGVEIVDPWVVGEAIGVGW